MKNPLVAAQTCADCKKPLESTVYTDKYGKPHCIPCFVDGKAANKGNAAKAPKSEAAELIEVKEAFEQKYGDLDRGK